MKKFVKSLVAVAALTLGTIAQAGPVVTQWTANVTAVWTAALPVHPFVITSLDGSRITWGSSPGGSYLQATSLTPVLIDTFLGDSPPDSAYVDHIQLDHGNVEINTPFLTSATLSVDLNITPNIPFGGPVKPLGITLFEIAFAETPNTVLPCVAASPVGKPCNDIFVLKGGLGGLSQTFGYDGNTYVASVLPSSGPLTFLSAAECLAADPTGGYVGDNACFGFTTVEGQVNTEIFKLAISAVPEPGTVALIGLALLGLGATRRRRAV